MAEEEKKPEVRVVDFQQKSLREREIELAGNTIQKSEVHKIVLPKDDEQNKPEDKNKPVEKPQDIELDDNKVLEYFNKKHNKGFKSLDEVLQPKTVEPELPEDVKNFWEFKKDTNRGLKDFMMAQEDVENINDDEKLRRYYQAKHPNFESDDISTLIEKFNYDEDMDDESDIKDKKLNKKLELEKATKLLSESKQKYSTKLESSIPKGEDSDKFKAWLEAQETEKQKKADLEDKRNIFLQKTNEFFSDKFKGFEIEIAEGKTLHFNPADKDKDKLKQEQSNTVNLFNKFLNKETGAVEDAKGLHTALAVGMNYKDFAKFMYDQGVADQVKKSEMSSKNIDMSGRSTFGAATRRGEGKVREVSSPQRRSRNSLSIKPFN